MSAGGDAIELEELSRDAFVARGLLSPERCARMIDRVEGIGFEQALFGGGETRLELAKGREVEVAPEVGALLCFDHHLMHEGMPLVRGTKYVLRTDLMWRKD